MDLEKVRTARRIVDIGSGLGFPGLVLAAMLPRARVTLVDKEARRCEFLRRAVDAMRLTNVEVVEGHVQHWSESVTDIDLVTVRSVARPSTVVRLAAPLLAIDGTALIWGKEKRDPAKEAEAAAAADPVGLRLATVHVTAPVTAGRRFLYVYEKVAATPLELPPKPKTVPPRINRKERKRARAVAVVENHAKAVKRLERASQKVRVLEDATEAADIRAVAQLERARENLREIEERVELLARRRARMARKINPPSR